MEQPPFRREAMILKALGNPKRLEIVYLLGRGQLTATAIERMTGFPQANVSQHLRALKEAHVIVAERNGKFIQYRLTHPSLLTITQAVRVTSAPQPPQRRETKKTEVQDPVCGMWVEPMASQFEAIYKGATFFFCASGCQKRFIHSPQEYVRPA